MRLRVSTHDGRGAWDRPICLIDRDTNRVVACYRSLADGTRARVLLEQLSDWARDFSAEQLHELAATTCERLHGSREFERLLLGQFNVLISTIRTDLRRS